MLKYYSESLRKVRMFENSPLFHPNTVSSLPFVISGSHVYSTTISWLLIERNARQILYCGHRRHTFVSLCINVSPWIVCID